MRRCAIRDTRMIDGTEAKAKVRLPPRGSSTCCAWHVRRRVLAHERVELQDLRQLHVLVALVGDRDVRRRELAVRLVRVARRPLLDERVVRLRRRVVDEDDAAAGVAPTSIVHAVPTVPANCVRVPFLSEERANELMEEYHQHRASIFARMRE